MPGDDFRSQVLQATDIVQLISETVSLKRRGKDYVGLCPFHQEKTPSFHVSPGKQFFHCYGCKEGGNAIDFVIKRDRIEFLDALRLLGERAGLEMPRYGVSKQKTGQRQLLLDAHSAACAFFEKSLNDSANGARAREYLSSRGFTEESAKRFQIGLAPEGWDNLLNALGRKYPAELLATAGLVKKRENGSGCYDTFRNRLMFPIRDEAGRIIAFGGRVMPGSTDPAKYLNSPETPLFNKSRAVFGLDLARQRIVETRTAVIVEGYTDVVMAHQYGVSNVVSILGTALTEQHVKVLQRFADKIVLLFDADTAGDKAVDKAVDLYLTQPVEICIAALPPGVDPDEFLMERGSQGFDEIVAQAKDALSYKWQQLQRLQEGASLTESEELLRRYLEPIAAARGSRAVDVARWGSILYRLQRLTGLSAEELNRRFAPPRGGTKPISRPSPAASGPAERNEANSPGGAAPAAPVDPRRWTAQDRAERWLLGALLLEPGRWHEVQKSVQVQDFTDPTRRALAEVYWTYQRDEGEPVFSELLTLLDERVKRLAVELVEEAESLPNMDETVRDAVDHFRKVAERREARKLVAALRRSKEQDAAAGGEASDGEDELAVLRKLQDKARQPDMRRIVS